MSASHNRNKPFPASAVACFAVAVGLFGVGVIIFLVSHEYLNISEEIWSEEYPLGGVGHDYKQALALAEIYGFYGKAVIALGCVVGVVGLVCYRFRKRD